jgi:hypothetical protein
MRRVDSLRLNFDRSLALHAAVAAKLRDHPEIIDQARSRIERWLSADGSSGVLLRQWQELLERPVDELVAFMTERSEEAAQMRKASPFAGALRPEERLRVLRDVRARLESNG